MKRIILTSALLFIFSTFISQPVFGQFDKIIDRASKRTESQAEKRVNRGVDNTVDKGFDEAEKGIKDGTQKDKNSKSTKTSSGNSNKTTANKASGANSNSGAASKYDFKAGSKPLFTENFSTDKAGTFPAGWVLVKGSASVGGSSKSRVLNITNPNTVLKPKLSGDYLSESFTIEIELYFYGLPSEAYTINLEGLGEIVIQANGAQLGSFNGTAANELMWENFRQVEIEYSGSTLKVFMDKSLVFEVPEIVKNPTGMVITAKNPGAETGEISMIGNVRIMGK